MKHERLMHYRPSGFIHRASALRTLCGARIIDAGQWTEVAGDTFSITCGKCIKVITEKEAVR